MKYNFDEYKLRNNMEAAKWDSMGPNAKEGIVPLSVADMELLSPPEIINELVKTAEFGMYGYTWWGERYANAVQHWMKTRHDWDIQKDWIVQLNGVVQGLACACRAFTEPGDNILLLTPIYYPFYTVIARNKRTLVESTVQLKDGKFNKQFNRDNWHIDLPQGVDFDLDRVSDTTAPITLKGQEVVDYDNNRTLKVEIDAKEVGDKDYLLSDQTVIEAVDDKEMLEDIGNLDFDSNTLVLKITGGKFNQNIKTSDLTLSEEIAQYVKVSDV